MAGGKHGIAILGVFVADLAFRAGRHAGHRRDDHRLRLQAGAGRQGIEPVGRCGARRRGRDLHLQDRQGRVRRDRACDLAEGRGEGARGRDRPTSRPAPPTSSSTTGPATTRSSSCPGAGGSITPADVDAAADTIRSSAVFVTQLEQPVDVREARTRDRPRGRRRDRLQSGARRYRSTMRSTRSATTSPRTRPRRRS